MQTLDRIKRLGLDSLESLGIRILRHPTDGRIILNYNQDEISSYFPSVSEKAEEYSQKIEKMWDRIDRDWFCYNDIPSRKKFAEAISKNPFRHILFQARDKGCHPKELFNVEFILENWDK